MSIATVTNKGQVTIPKPVREALRLAALYPLKLTLRVTH